MRTVLLLSLLLLYRCAGWIGSPLLLALCAKLRGGIARTAWLTMDKLSSCVGAASLLGLSSSHVFVYLSRVLQETCMKIEECTDGEVLVSVVVSRPDGPGGVLLYASGFVDGVPDRDVSTRAVAQLSVGVDSLILAL